MADNKIKTIYNPCYHCYQGAVGYCSDYGCQYALEPWAQDLETLQVDVPVEIEECVDDGRE